jgi:cyclophilin family peptidyl-prolyl cis-trans isomerase
LDQNYTVLGEVIKGMVAVDSIASEPTNSNNRPLKEARIMSVKLVKRTE